MFDNKTQPAGPCLVDGDGRCYSLAFVQPQNIINADTYWQGYENRQEAWQWPRHEEHQDQEYWNTKMQGDADSQDQEDWNSQDEERWQRDDGCERQYWSWSDMQSDDNGCWLKDQRQKRWKPWKDWQDAKGWQQDKGWQEYNDLQEDTSGGRWHSSKSLRTTSGKHGRWYAQRTLVPCPPNYPPPMPPYKRRRSDDSGDSPPRSKPRLKPTAKMKGSAAVANRA